MRIATFGSCLSRYIANHYTYLFGGSIVSSVYHNRSDSFLSRFVDLDSDFKVIDKLIEYYSEVDEKHLDVDNQQVRILRNQSRLGIGLHRLSSGSNFIAALKSKPDVVILDNYMDLAARHIIEKDSASDVGVFAKLNGIDDNLRGFELGGYLDTNVSVSNFERIISFILTLSPCSKVIFVNFPWNTYKDSSRISRTIDFESSFYHPNAFILPCFAISERMQTNQKQHFKPYQYAAYAGFINNMLRSK